MNVRALAELYDQHGARLFRYALSILGDVQAAEDVLQESFALLTAAARPKPELLNVAYLTTIVRNESYSTLRRRRRQVSDAASILEPPPGGTNSEEQAVLNSALKTLPAEQREVIFLKIHEGLTFTEIGERCGCSPNTAASRYRYALDAMRRVLNLEKSSRD